MNDIYEYIQTIFTTSADGAIFFFYIQSFVFVVQLYASLFSQIKKKGEGTRLLAPQVIMGLNISLSMINDSLKIPNEQAKELYFFA